MSRVPATARDAAVFLSRSALFLPPAYGFFRRFHVYSVREAARLVRLPFREKAITKE